MKLISCYITNFGKLKDFNYDFNSNLNVINEHNGWGKTTFADFIKAMLYSLPASRARNLKDNPRKKYKPWDGGEFGGNLVIEVNDNIYRIERTFGTTESEDTFALYNEKTNKPSKDFSSNIGFEIFGLDSESFSNTTYLPQLDLKINLTDNISAKLNDLTQDQDDVNSYNNAITLIDEKRKIYQKTGERGKYYDIKRELEKIDSEKESFANLTAIIEDLEINKNQLKDKILKLENDEKSINESIKSSISSEKYKNLNALKEEIKSLENELEKIKNKLHGSIPSLEELTLKRKSSEELKELEININHLNQKLDELEPQIEKIHTFFNNKDLSQEEINNINEKYKIFQINQNKNSESHSVSTYKTKNKQYFIPLVIAIISLILISVLFAINVISPIVFVIILAVLIISISVSIFIIRQRQLKNIKTKSYSSEIQKIENDLLKLLLIFNYDENLNIDTKMHIFRENLELKDNLTKVYNDLNNNLNELINKKSNIELSLNKFIEFYNNSNNASSISDIIYSMTQDVLKYNELLRLYENKKQSYDSLSSNIDLNAIKNTEQSLSLEELNISRKNIIEELNTSRKELSEVKLSLERYKIKYDELDELLLKENELKAEFELITNKLKVLEITDKYLKLAKEELDSAFIKPIANNFSELVNSLNASDIKNFKIDTNFNITVEHNGQTRELSFFSKGYQDIAYICARLSSLKAMFKNDKPFVILDDPFVNLDKEKLELAKVLLEKLSKEYQIIYLVCHDSRK